MRRGLGWVAMAFAFAGAPAAQAVPLRWDLPQSLEFQGASLGSLSCPSATQCTGAADGDEETFDPQDRRPTLPVQVNADPASCPTVSECVGIDNETGNELTFDPQGPIYSRPVQIDPQRELTDIACPAATQCTALDAGNGELISFDPQAPAPTIADAPDPGALRIACPAGTECLSVGSDGALETFDPQAPGSLTRIGQIPRPGDRPLLVCASTAECTVLGGGGQAVTVDPETGTTLGVRTLPENGFTGGLACASVTLCVDTANDAVTAFDPVGSAPGQTTTIDHSELGLGAVACPLATQCTALDSEGNEVTFNPAAPGRPALLPGDRGGGAPGFNSLSCPARQSCVAVDSFGREFTFDPSEPQDFTRAQIGHRVIPLVAVSCPATTQCTAVDNERTAFTFDPLHPARRHSRRLPVGGTRFATEATAVDCPVKDQCSAILQRLDRTTLEVTFNPLSARAPAVTAVDDKLVGVKQLACPLATQCTIVDRKGREITFDPSTGHVGRKEPIDPHPLNTVTCLSATFCVAADAIGERVTFDPRTGHAGAPLDVNGDIPLRAITCRSRTFCVATGTVGTITQGSATGSTPWLRTVLPVLTGFLGTRAAFDGVACVSATLCVAVNGQGRLSSGTP